MTKEDGCLTLTDSEHDLTCPHRKLVENWSDLCIGVCCLPSGEGVRQGEGSSAESQEGTEEEHFRSVRDKVALH